MSTAVKWIVIAVLAIILIPMISWPAIKAKLVKTNPEFASELRGFPKFLDKVTEGVTGKIGDADGGGKSKLDPGTQKTVNLIALLLALGTGWVLGGRSVLWGGTKEGPAWGSKLGGKISVSHVGAGSSGGLLLILLALTVWATFYANFAPLLKAWHFPWSWPDWAVAVGVVTLGYLLATVIKRPK